MPQAPTSRMAEELAQSGAAVARLIERSDPRILEAADRLRALDPPVVVTLARGSSDHATLVFKYAAEILIGRPVASLGPAVASIYGAPLRLSGAAAIAVSQSGRSPDLVAALAAARAGGACTIALVNADDTPLADAADFAIPLQAGAEESVAATKSFVASVAALLLLLGHWSEDARLVAAVRGLPEHLDRAARLDWRDGETALDRPSLFVLGRGPAFGIAAEAALKAKEILGLHAEALSGAEVMHGPLALVGEGFPIVAFVADDASRAGMEDALARLGRSGATVVAAASRPLSGATMLPVVATGHPWTDALAMIVPWYALVERAARPRGLDPDRPPRLSKVTRTV